MDHFSLLEQSRIFCGIHVGCLCPSMTVGICCCCCSAGTALVRIATRYGLDRPGFESRKRKEIFLFSKTSRPALGPTQLSIQCVSGWGRGLHRVLIGKPEGKRPLGRPRRRWEDNIKMDLREVGGGGGDWMELAEDRDRWRALVGTMRNLRVP